MLKKILFFILFNIIFCLSFSISWSSVDKEISTNDDFFDLHQKLLEEKINSEEDYFYKNYYLAKTSLNEDEIISFYNKIINNKYENYKEYSYTLLDMAKLFYYKKNYDLSLDYALGIKDEELDKQKTLLLAKIYLAQKDYYKSISYSQEYIKKYAQSYEVENMYFLIVEAFLENKEYDKAKDNLDYICITQDFPKNQEGLKLYKAAYCDKMLGEEKKANNTINKLTSEYPHNYWTKLFLKNNFLKEEKIENNSNLKQKYFLQTGVFENISSAQEQAENLKKLLNYPVLLEDKQKDNKPCKAVIIGYFDNEQNATLERIKKSLKENNYSFCLLSESSEEKSMEKGKYYLQLGAYKEEEKQKIQMEYWTSNNYNVLGYEKNVRDINFFCVAIGPYDDKESAKNEQNNLREKNINSLLFIGN